MSNGLTLKQQKFVDAYIGPAAGNATEAARLAGYKGSDTAMRVTGHDNLAKPNIALQITKHREKLELRAIADLQSRVDGYDKRRNELLSIIAERSVNSVYQKVPGGRSGWLVHTVKQIGGGFTAERVEEFAFDSALHKELRELEKQAAQDLGQWQDQKRIEVAIQVKDLADRVADDLGLSTSDVLAEAERILIASGMVD